MEAGNAEVHQALDSPISSQAAQSTAKTATGFRHARRETPWLEQHVADQPSQRDTRDQPALSHLQFGDTAGESASLELGASFGDWCWGAELSWPNTAL